jgi:hypothetical protein
MSALSEGAQAAVLLRVPQRSGAGDGEALAPRAPLVTAALTHAPSVVCPPEPVDLPNAKAQLRATW